MKAMRDGKRYTDDGKKTKLVLSFEISTFTCVSQEVLPNLLVRMRALGKQKLSSAKHYLRNLHIANDECQKKKSPFLLVVNQLLS